MCIKLGEVEDELGGILEAIENELDSKKGAALEQKKQMLEQKLVALEGEYLKDLADFEKLEKENLRGKKIPGPWDDVINAKTFEAKAKACYINSPEKIKEHQNKGLNLVLDYLEQYIVGRDVSKIPEKEKMDLEKLFRRQFPCKVKSFDKSKKPVLYEILPGSNPSDQEEMFQALLKLTLISGAFKRKGCVVKYIMVVVDERCYASCVCCMLVARHFEEYQQKFSKNESDDVHV